MSFYNNAFNGMTLKALLENPGLQHAPSALSGGVISKDKKGSNGSADIDFTSAFLGPQLWDKTFNTSDFNLDIDLDDLLAENNIPVVDNPGLVQMVASAAPSPPRLSPSHAQDLLPYFGGGPSPQSPQSFPAGMMSPDVGKIWPGPPANAVSPSHFLLTPKEEKVEDPGSRQENGAMSPGARSAGSTPPVSPRPLQVDFRLTEQDIVLSSVPGQSVFDPTAHSFTEDELKPQPMIKKSRKVYVPDEMKDEKYWARRRKNNNAAKRSRDAKRVKENQIAMRTAYLEKENTTLKEELEKMQRENARLKHRLSKFESANNST